MDDFDAIAARLFGSTAPSAAPAPAQDSPAPATGEQTAAERLFGVKPQAETQPRPELRDDRAFSELSEAEQAQRLYGSTDPTLTHRDAVQAIVNASMQDHLHDPETAGEIAAAWAATFSQHQLNATESKELADIGASAMRTPPSEATVLTWRETAIENLQAEYGVEGAGHALQDARAYIAGVPDAADMLNALGLGSHPRIVALAAARGRALRLAGKLKG
ncbi:hypothetical protein dqs_1791 [Azoarcus olearius]|uniref:hypothetical protein n=1 Tax=Azoarcus sp. (strain BH72) TaxID=418699 RepID=UPI00080616C7|nr:hypothetical protein [Azoarcus olearius]ANQ84829.1 hypothetical protein dqs_1791 [Azoarcus olearius]